MSAGRDWGSLLASATPPCSCTLSILIHVAMQRCPRCTAVIAGGKKVGPYQSVKLGTNVLVEASCCVLKRRASYHVGLKCFLLFHLFQADSVL